MQEINIEGVKFQPWVGKDYDKGFVLQDGKLVPCNEQNKNSVKILVLGESHYCDNTTDAENPNLTRKIIKDYLASKEFEPYMATYIKFERALVGELVEDKVDVWEHMAFYNYVQKAMPSPRVSPAYADFSNSETAYWNVINQLTPDVIICLGVRLYSNIPQCNGNDRDISFPFEDEDECVVWLYSDSNTYVIPVYHPSSAFSWEYWHKKIITIIDKYGK